MAALYLLCWYILGATQFGRAICAIGKGTPLAVAIAHHCALGAGHQISKIRKLARLLDLELVVI